MLVKPRLYNNITLADPGYYLVYLLQNNHSISQISIIFLVNNCTTDYSATGKGGIDRADETTVDPEGQLKK